MAFWQKMECRNIDERANSFEHCCHGTARMGYQQTTGGMAERGRTADYTFVDLKVDTTARSVELRASELDAELYAEAVAALLMSFH